MNFVRKHLNIIVFIVSLLLVGVDQLIKYFAIQYLAPLDTYPLWEDILHLTYIENKGAAFGILSGKTFWLVGVTGIVILALIIALLLKKIRSPWLMWAVGLIIGGGIGNLIDRICRGYVVDYIHVKLIKFAIFNFADCCVVIGTIMLVVYFLLIEGRESKKKKNLSDVEANDRTELPQTLETQDETHGE